MSDKGDSTTGSLVPASRLDAAQTAPVNPLVLRGLVDVATCPLPKVSEATPHDPSTAVLCDIRGSCWHLKENYERAIRYFNKAIRLDPNCAVTYLHRGQAWLGKGDPDKALRDFDEAIRLDPDNATAYYCRGKVWCNWGFYGKANKDFDEAIRRDPHNALIHDDRGTCGRRTSVIKDLDEARLASAKLAEQPEPFGGCEWLWVAQDWCRLKGYEMSGWRINQTFRIGADYWLSVGWNEVTGAWDVLPKGG